LSPPLQHQTLNLHRHKETVEGQQLAPSLRWECKKHKAAQW